MKKTIYVCPKCGKALNFSDNPEYTFQCFDCDEDFYAFEAVEKEFDRIEGVKDFTNLVDVAERINAIKNQVIEENTKLVAIKSNDIIGQIGEYIYATIKPVLESKITNNSKFRENTEIRTMHLKFNFLPDGYSYHKTTPYNASLVLCHAGCYSTMVCFNKDLCIVVDDAEVVERERRVLPDIVAEWKQFKDSMNHVIPEAIDAYNKSNAKQAEETQKRMDVINNFKL